MIGFFESGPASDSNDGMAAAVGVKGEMHAANGAAPLTPTQAATQIGRRLAGQLSKNPPKPASRRQHAAIDRPMQVKSQPALRSHDHSDKTTLLHVEHNGQMAKQPDKTTQKRAYRKTPKCPHCQQPITRAQIAAMLSAQRTTRSGGRPTQGPRCACGLMSAARAKARHHQCEPKGKNE